MSTQKQIRYEANLVFNPIGRVDIAPRNIAFETGTYGDDIRYRIHILNWDSLRDLADHPNYDVSVIFTRSGMPDIRKDLGKVKSVLRGGVLSGRVGGGFNPETLGVIVLVTNPSKNHVIVLRGRKGKPDATDADIPDAPDGDTPIRPIRRSSGKEDGMLNICEDDSTVTGQWDVLLSNGEVPQLVVSSKLGKESVVNDPFVQNLILPEVFRRVLSAMVKESERYQDMPWYSPWKQFVVQVAEVDTFEDFLEYVDDDTLEGDIDTFIGRAVSLYVEKMLPPMSKRTTNSENVLED